MTRVRVDAAIVDQSVTGNCGWNFKNNLEKRTA